MERLTIQQEAYCTRRMAGDTQRAAYRAAYPRSQAWKDNSVDRQASVLEALPKVCQRLEALKAEAAAAAKLTRTELIDRIADVNGIAYGEIVVAGTSQNASMSFTATSKQLLDYSLVDEDPDEMPFVADYAMLIGPSFLELHRDIDAHGHTDYALQGGRGSLKSSFISLELIRLVLRNPNHNAVVIRKVQNTLRKSAYAQCKWAIGKLDVADRFKATVSPMELTVKGVGQKVIFVGLDDPEKLKSLTFEHGYPAIIWFEEAYQFTEEELRNATQTLARGGSLFWRFYSWNPPRNKRAWVNRWARRDVEGRIVHHSTYLKAPREWLGEQFFQDADELKKLNKKAYRHEYLGQDVGTDGEVFQNIVEREITDDEINNLDYIRCGLDWGYFPDPWCFGPVGYDRKTKTVYILDEAYGTRISDERAVREVKRILTEVINGKEVFNARAKYNEVYCDRDPKSIATYRELGINARATRKWKGSVDDGVKWLQTRTAIVIDRKRSPLSAQEFTAYEYVDDGEGGLKTYADKDNHSIDKARYALSPLIAAKKEV